MELPANLLSHVQNAAGSPGQFLAGLKPGAILTALVSGQNASGQTLLLIGNRQIPVILAQPLAVGTQVNLQVQNGASGAHLVVVSTFEAGTNTGRGPVVPQAGSQAPPSPAASAITPPPTSVAGQATVAALANQGSVSALISSLLRLGSRLEELPPNVRAAIERLSAAVPRLKPDGTLDTNLRQAIAQSGIFLEAGLASAPIATPMPGDLKALLLLLKGALAGWLGPETGGDLPGRRPLPPVRGNAPRATANSPLPFPADATSAAIGRQLLAQTNSALSRLYLLQLASLPDTQAGSGTRHEWQAEVPFVFGQDASTLNLQVFRDGQRSTNGEHSERGWHLRFAMNASIMGEVGAEIAVLNRTMTIVIWAEKEEVARALHENLAELSDAVGGLGLSVSAIRIRRHGAAGQPQKPAGSLLDLGT